MKKFLSKLLLPTFLFLLIFYSSQGHAQQPVGTLTEANGHVNVTREDGSQTDYARASEVIHLNDTVATGKKSSAKVTLKDATVLNLVAKSKVYISQFLVASNTRKTTIDVHYGRVKASIQKVFGGQGAKTEFTTPTAVVGIRGTELVIDVRGDQTKVYCLKGVVEVRNADIPGQIVRVVAGMATDVLLNQIPTNPAQIPAEILNGLMNNANIPVNIPSSPLDIPNIPGLPF